MLLKSCAIFYLINLCASLENSTEYTTGYTNFEQVEDLEYSTGNYEHSTGIINIENVTEKQDSTEDEYLTSNFEGSTDNSESLTENLLSENPENVTDYTGNTTDDVPESSTDYTSNPTDAPEDPSNLTENPEDPEKNFIDLGEKNLSEYVTLILDHYKQSDPIGIPIIPIPDPLDIPPSSHSISFGRMRYRNVQVHGLSRFRVQHVRTDLVGMNAETTVTLASLNVTGNYTLTTWFSEYLGPFTVNLTQVEIKANGRLQVQEDGHIEVEEIDTGLNYSRIDMNFEGFGMINTAGDFVFETVKPYVLQEVNENIKNDINVQARRLPHKFPNSIAPFDQLMIVAREKVRLHYDPLRIEDCNYTSSIFEIRLSRIYLSGLSSFHRDGNVTFEIRNGTVRLDAKIATQKLKGMTHWEVNLLGGSRLGTAGFTMEHLKVRIILIQPLNTRHPAKLDRIHLDFGNFAMRFNGAGTTLDYGIELAANIIPNLLRMQIAQVLQVLIKERVSEVLKEIRTDRIIEENLPKLEQLQRDLL